MTTHVVYRLYDRSNELLYVGSTADLSRRLNEHRNRQRWGGEIAKWTATARMSRKDALRAEAEAIRSEKPWFNRRHPEYVDPTPEEVAAAVRSIRLPGGVEELIRSQLKTTVPTQ